MMMEVIEACLAVIHGERSPGDSAYDPLFHARRSDNVGFLLRNFRKVVEQLQGRLGFAFDPFTG